MAKSMAERKRDQRRREVQAGWKHVSVRIPAHREAELHAFVKGMGDPDPQHELKEKLANTVSEFLEGQ